VLIFSCNRIKIAKLPETGPRFGTLPLEKMIGGKEVARASCSYVNAPISS